MNCMPLDLRRQTSVGKTQGFLVLNIRQDQYNSKTDNAEKMICDYFEPNKSDEPDVDSQVTATIKYAGKPEVRVGGSWKKFTPVFTSITGEEVAEVAKWSFICLDEFCNLIKNNLRGRRVGDLVDLDHVPFLDIAPFRPQAERAAARLINLQHLGRVIENFSARREIRGQERIQKICVRVFDERDCRPADLGQIERADIRRHADGDAHVGRDQHVRERCRQQHRLLHGAVVIVDKVDRVGVNVAEPEA